MAIVIENNNERNEKLKKNYNLKELKKFKIKEKMPRGIDSGRTLILCYGLQIDKS